MYIDSHASPSRKINNVGHEQEHVIFQITSLHTPKIETPQVFQPESLHTFNPEYKLEGHDQIVDGFVPEIRKEIGRRDRWVCQGIELLDGCYWTPINGKPARFQDGYMVQAAHYPDKQKYTGKGYHDKNPEHGRCLCTACHALEEVANGNLRGARLLISSNSVYTYSHEKETGQQHYLDIEWLVEEYRKKIEEKDKEKLVQLKMDLGEFAKA